MRRWLILILVSILVTTTNAQFGEIASLATSLLGSALGGGGGIGALAGAGAAGAGAASQAGGALAQIGQLYQLAQGALQLTGTGVGVLNQASEGNWFPAVLEQTAKSSQSLMRPGGAGGLNLGALGPAPAKPGAGLGPEFGTSFPAPNIDDYDENAEIPGPPDGLIDIDSGDYEGEVVQATTTLPPASTTISTTTTELVTLFPEDGEEVTPEPTTPTSRQIRIQLPDKNGNSGVGTEEELDYEDLIKNSKSKTGTPEKVVLPTIDAESSEELKKNVITHGTKTKPIVPKLDKLIVSQVEGNKRIEKPPKYDFNSGVQNINEKKNEIRQKITDASRQINANLENQGNENRQTIESTVNELKVIPDLSNTVVPTLAPRVIAHTLPTIPRHIPQPRSVATPLAVPASAPAPAVAASTQVQQATVAPQPQVAQPQPAAQNYLYPQQTYQTQQQQQQYQQYYYHQQQPYGQQTQNYWGYNQYGQPQYYTTQVPQQPQANYYYNQNQYYQQQQQQQAQRVAQPQPQQQIYQQLPAQPQPQPQQQGLPAPTRVPVAAPTPVIVQQTTPPPAPQATQNPNQVFHYYHDGRQIIQQIIPKQLVQRNNLPLNGPFKSQNVNAAPTDQNEYLRRQRALSQAYTQPRTRTNAVAHQASTQNIPNPKPAPKIFESTVSATGHSQAHAIRTYQATANTAARVQQNPVQPSAKPRKLVQPPAPVRSTGRFATSQKRPVMSGHVIPGPTIDHRSIQEKRTTAKPRFARMP
ncbi:unnamed protein product [Caenorhabditis angaria]|uniref:Uncharacterized protein n=1 Tax=Caenorhabditis angaria TaxID=860376 RepID=A0A9P1J2N2_9PELO|nr:unnamed protein product [Caenorhabditis angaria]